MKNSSFWKFVGFSVVVCLFSIMATMLGTVALADTFGDQFNAGELQNPSWKWQNEPPTWDIGDTREGYLYIDSQPNRNVWASDDSHLLYQDTDTDMFDVSTHFRANWDANSGVNGILVKSPADNNWVTVKFWSRDAGPQGHIQYQTRQAGMGPPDALIFTEDVNVVTAVEPNDKQYMTWGRIKTAEVFQNYPNPFNPETWIPYTLNDSSKVEISIFSQGGELVREFKLGILPSGEKRLFWDGKNSDGETVSSGIYFYQFKAGNTKSVRKMWLMK